MPHKIPAKDGKKDKKRGGKVTPEAETAQKTALHIPGHSLTEAAISVNASRHQAKERVVSNPAVTRVSQASRSRCQEQWRLWLAVSEAVTRRRVQVECWSCLARRGVLLWPAEAQEVRHMMRKSAASACNVIFK